MKVLFLFLVLETLTSAAQIDGFSRETNVALSGFFAGNKEATKRKVAVFDFDGTLVGQRPYYSTDEFFIRESEEHRLISQHLPQIADIFEEYSPAKNYYLLIGKDLDLALKWRALVYHGHELSAVRERAQKFMNTYYGRKVFAPCQELIKLLHANGFEVWVVTAAIEYIVEDFIEERFAIPVNRVIGAKTLSRNGVLTDRFIGIVPNEAGKVDMIESFIKTKPLLVAGNSSSDKEMIDYSSGISLVINPSAELSIHAKKRKWLIERVDDPVLPGDSEGYKKYGLQPNR